MHVIHLSFKDSKKKKKILKKKKKIFFLLLRKNQSTKKEVQNCVYGNFYSVLHLFQNYFSLYDTGKLIDGAKMEDT